MKTVLVLMCLLGMTLAEIHHIGLRRRLSLMETKIADGTWSDYVKQRELKKLIILASGGQPLKDYSNTGYDAPVCVGTPCQNFNIIPDTGSSNFWVVSKNCGSGGNCPSWCNNAYLCFLCPSSCSCKGLKAAGPCDGKNMYDSTKSSTYQKDGRSWSIQYGTGSASGILDSDMLTWTGTTLKDRVTFGEATHLAQFFTGQSMDGILGLAYQSIAVDHILPPFYALINDKLLDQPIFTFWMTELPNTPTGQIGGLLTLGGYDTTHCQISDQKGTGVSWVTLTSKTYYQFDISGWSDGTSSSNSRQSAIADTGTSLIAGPSSPIQKIGTDLGGQYNSNYGVYMISCTATPAAVTYTINGKTYTIQYKNYIINAGQGQCFLGFQAFSSGFGGPQWILGDVFIRQYCTVFDPTNGRVGFAAATA